MRIREVEMLVGISKKNIRFYEDAGLLKPGRNAENSYREYSEEDVRTLRRIKLLRKLDIPVSEIRSLLEGECSLREVCLGHSARLEDSITDLKKAKCLTERLVTECADVSAMDEERWLRELAELEREGASFMNIGEKDIRKRSVGAAVACVCCCIVFTAFIALILWAQSVEPIPLGIIIALIAVFVGCIICTAAAFISRYREIKGGEENDLGNY